MVDILEHCDVSARRLDHDVHALPLARLEQQVRGRARGRARVRGRVRGRVRVARLEQ